MGKGKEEATTGRFEIRRKKGFGKRRRASEMKGKAKRWAVALFAVVAAALVSTTAFGATPAMNKKSAAIYYPGTMTLKVKNLGKVKVKSWKTSNKAVATVSGGKVTAKKKGKATITATLSNGKKCTCAVTVKYRLVTSVKMDASRSMFVGKSLTLKPTLAPSNASIKKLTWKSTNKAIATVDSSGKVTAVKAGKATISATTTDGSKKTAKCVITVKSETKVSSVSVTTPSSTVSVGSLLVVNAKVAPSTATNKAVAWSSSNQAIATVSSTGVVTGVRAGTVTIKATAQDGSGKYGSVSITVKDPTVKVTGVTVTASSTSVEVGSTVTARATVSPSNASNKAVTWSSSNASVATVTSGGVVRGIKQGTVTIKATAQDGSGKSGSISMTVTQRQDELEEEEEDDWLSAAQDEDDDYGNDDGIRRSPLYSYSAQVVNMNGIYTRSENNEDLRGVLIKVTTTNPNWDDVVFKVDGNLAAVGFVRFDDVTGNGYAIARTSFSQPGTHTVKVVEGYWANEVQGDYRTVDTNATVTFTVKKFETERANWIDSLITNHRRSTDKETLQAICDWLKANLHYKAYIVDANGNLVRRANLIRHYGSLLHNWDCWGTTELMIDVAKRLNPNLTGSWGTMAGNDPEIDWHRLRDGRGVRRLPAHERTLPDRSHKHGDVDVEATTRTSKNET